MVGGQDARGDVDSQVEGCSASGGSRTEDTTTGRIGSRRVSARATGKPSSSTRSVPLGEPSSALSRALRGKLFARFRLLGLLSLRLRLQPG